MRKGQEVDILDMTAVPRMRGKNEKEGNEARAEEGKQERRARKQEDKEGQDAFWRR